MTMDQAKRTAGIALSLLVATSGMPSPSWGYFLPKKLTPEDLTQGPVVKVVTQADQKRLDRVLGEADLVFVAKIQAIVLSPLLMAGPSMYLTRVSFSNIEMLLGEKPPQQTFDYLKPRKAPDFYHGMKVIVILKRMKKNEKMLNIISIVEANPTTLSIVDQALVAERWE